ncbi:MAG: RNA-directed DNA polymerase [Acidobacteria bacterium]|nr:RNA-directed DNA polymerase [Acidobacteriota bacterium]
MRPAAAAREWGLPAVATPGDLAAMLGLEAADLDWFADLRGWGAGGVDAKLEHYRYRVVPKRSGRLRLIEAPKQRLKQVQRRLLAEILRSVPPHPAVHGFVAGRSVATFAEPHTAKRMVLKMDLRDFFPSVRAARIEAFFRTAGYPEPVARALTGLVTNAAPRRVFAKEGELGLVHGARSLYCRPHLPQGAPTSPALANICFRRADQRLEALARSAGADYTRYADDLAFSGGDDFARHARRFSLHVAAIATEEGFAVEHRKTRLAPESGRQRLAGVVVNHRPSLPRAEIETLEAILTNCARDSPETQNRDGHPRFREHLAGRIAYLAMLNPSKAAKLRAIFDRIAWT